MSGGDIKNPMSIDMGEDMRRTMDALRVCGYCTSCDECPNRMPDDDPGVCRTAAETLEMIDRMAALIRATAEEYIRLKLYSIKRQSFNHGLEMMRFRRMAATALKQAGFTVGDRVKAMELPKDAPVEELENAAIKIHEKAEAKGGFF